MVLLTPFIFSNNFFYQAIDSFLKFFGDLEIFRLSTKEWEVLQEFAYVLSVHSPSVVQF